VSRNRK